MLRAGRGHDDLHPSGDGVRDVLRGGPGEDELDFLYRSEPAAVALAGTGGEDAVRGVEEVYGTPATDTLTGNARANLINGGGGDDPHPRRGWRR